MTTHKEKSPLTVGAVNEESKSIEERSNQTVYIAAPRLNTGETLGTFSKKQLPRNDYIALVVSTDQVLHMMNGNPVLFQVDPEDIEAHNLVVSRRREKEEAERKDKLERQAANLVYEKYDEIYKQIDAEADKLYSAINTKVHAEIQETIKRLEVQE
ncbi:MAG: hypothetical protein Q4F10_04735 [Corynebacterium glutamicum]|nr:hypothetical protein [Corynebacterium glutamicum]